MARVWKAGAFPHTAEQHWAGRLLVHMVKCLDAQGQLEWKQRWICLVQGIETEALQPPLNLFHLKASLPPHGHKLTRKKGHYSSDENKQLGASSIQSWATGRTFRGPLLRGTSLNSVWFVTVEKGHTAQAVPHHAERGPRTPSFTCYFMAKLQNTNAT